MMPLRHLPPHLNGSTLVQISDLHISNRYNWNYQIKELRRVQSSRPDFIVYTGDFITYRTSAQFTQLAQLLSQAPLGQLGTIAILGNHDYGHGWRQMEVAERVVDLLQDAGITVLRNQIQVSAGLQIAGLEDYQSPNFDPGPVLLALDPNLPSLVLCHNPDVADLPIWSTYKGWILTGHTHGGQVKLPFLPPPLVPVINKSYTSGQFNLGQDRMMYINRGLGNLWPLRFNARPEVTTFTLVGRG
jgi:predicted MPP superfamily phosphohydrolase